MQRKQYNLIIMRKILTFLLVALFGLTVTAQNLEHVIDLDELVANEGFLLSQNNPNLFEGTTDVYLAVMRNEPVTLTIADIYGQMTACYTGSFKSGVHQFRITLKAKGTYVMGAHQNGKSSSIVLFCHQGGRANTIDYIGMAEEIDPAIFDILMDEDKEEDFAGYSAIKSATNTVMTDEPFRVALSLSPFTLNQFEAGYTFKIGDKTATTPSELQQIYRDLGATEMYVRLATKRHKTYKTDGTLDNTTDGKPDENANVHTFDQVMQTCKIAAALNMPINPEVMCAYIYMDMDGTQAPRFYKSDYPELYANPTFASIMKNGDAKWEELSLKTSAPYWKYTVSS